MTLFVKYIAAIISSFTLLFSTTGVSLLHHICLQMGIHYVSLNYDKNIEDECGIENMSCETMGVSKDNTQTSFSMLECCKEFSDYTVLSAAYISQQIEKFSSKIVFNTEIITNYILKFNNNSDNNILVKPPGILKIPVSYIISFILHSTDIDSELPA